MSGGIDIGDIHVRHCSELPHAVLLATDDGRHGTFRSLTGFLHGAGALVHKLGRRDLIRVDGGVLGALVGGTAINTFANLQFDFALIGATALNCEGCWTTEFTETEIKKSIITRARRRIVLADQSKWQAPGTVLFSAWENINDWVVDQLPTDAAQALPQSVSVHH